MVLIPGNKGTTFLIRSYYSLFTKSWYQGIPFEKLDELYALRVSPRHFQQRANETSVVEASQKGDSLHVEAC